MGERRQQSRLMVLMFTDIVGSVDLRRRLGEQRAAQIIKKHDELFRYTVSAFPFAEIVKDLGDGFLAHFGGASDAVHAALHFQHALNDQKWEGEQIKVRVGVHLGEVSELETESGTGRPKLSGMAVDITARVMSLALPGQILMTRAAFDNARQFVREHQSTDGQMPSVTRKWMAHGRYLFKGAEEPIEVFEVGEVGTAPLAVPPDTDKARRSVAADQEETLGWRPAVGLEIPDRKYWILERRLGEGGFGEVWLGENQKTHTRRVFKFCFDSERLRSFKRELMLFRLLRDALGDRNDIAKLHEVQVDHAPFYLESEFTEDGSLVEWSEQQKGIDKVPVTTRLDIVARTAIAVSAAHSVGVLHKDIKPSNILVYRDSDGTPKPRLTDFGIGELTDPSQLAKRNITMIAATQSLVAGSDSSRTGTRIYAPPEVLVGKPFTIQGDVYALGVLLYQMVIGDIERPLAQGWERDVADPLLRDDISRCVEGHPSARLGSAKELAERLQSLPARRRARQRRRIARASVAASIVLIVLLSISGLWLVRERGLRAVAEHEKDKALAVIDFIPSIFGAVDPRAGDVSGRDVKVVDRLDEAVRKLDAGELSHEPEIEALARAAIGAAYKSLSQYKDAEAQFEKSLTTRQKVLGPAHADIADSLEDLSAAKWFLGDFDAAEKLARDSYEMRLTLFGPESLEVASSLNYLAAALDRLGQRAEAERLYRQSLAIRDRITVGVDRELVARSMNNLATCLRAQNKDEEAERLFRQAIDLVRELRGAEYLDVANGLSNLAFFYLKTKQYVQAENSFLEALKIKRKVYGDIHSSVAVTLHGLCEVNLNLNRLDEAERYGREAVAVREVTLGRSHTLTSLSLDFLARALMASRKFPEAEQTIRKCIEYRENVPIKDELQIADCQSRLGECLIALNRASEAEPLLIEGYERLKAVLGKKDERALGAANRLIEYFENNGRKADAEAIRRSVPNATASNVRTP